MGNPNPTNPTTEPIHHHHFYDEHDQPAILTHSHPYENVRHLTKLIPDGLPIYWDHEGVECDGLAEAP